MSEWTAETAEWYAENYGEYATNRMAVETLDLGPADVVVDVGCGTGAAIRSAAARVTTGRLIGVDPVPRMVEIARERMAGHAANDRIEIREGYAHALPVDSGTADWVLALDSYDHWGAHQAEGLREVVRVLKATGRFIVVKDESIPQEPDDREAFLAALGAAGLCVKQQKELAGNDVSFTLWVCERQS